MKNITALIRASKAHKRSNVKETWQHDKDTQVPGADVHGDEVVQVEFTPLLHLGGESGAEQSAANFRRGAGQEDGGQLLPEASLTILKQLIRLVHDQPLHTARAMRTEHRET